MIVSLAFLGIALFSTLIHIKNSTLLWLFGLVTLFAGAYFTYSAEGISLWKESVVSNTTILGSSMMFYMLFLSMVIAYFLESSKKVGVTAVICLGTVDAILFIIPLVTKLFFYDMWFYWVGAQLMVNLVLLICLVNECFCPTRHGNWLYISAILPLIAFGVDAAMTAAGIWKGGIVSKYVFILLFAIAMVVVLRIIPQGINTYLDGADTHGTHDIDA